ncbi:hypothetical protein TWF192_000083 [Orbilia oligospora]|uniref:F-box domain-containing protein n=1 Tax=Orbilia oligospora TaxID=2813651 RepID=A0A6G1MPI4_ORBOL|nr:hypothetical protein TWF679_011067 [Orbilia oligospora]KAF3231361.1 hypothetical protein TWF191_006849 [Orbilia oligospora]KAF3265433.1 hypothetical protein TWF192_000083 [Orbilia oligospora]
MSAREDEEVDFLAFPEPSPTSSLEDLSNIATRDIDLDEYGSPKSKPNFISRVLSVATNSYKSSTTSRIARKLFYTALNISPRGGHGRQQALATPSKIPIDKYFPVEIHLQIFSYLPWETLLACSLASRIWRDTLWHHGQDHGFIKSSKDRYTAPRKYIGILYHKILYHRPCVLGISRDGITSVHMMSISPWEPVPLAINKSKLRSQKPKPSILSPVSASSSSSEDSSADVVCNDDQAEGQRIAVFLNPENNFVMNDVLLKLNPIYTPKPTMVARLLAILSGLNNVDHYTEYLRGLDDNSSSSSSSSFIELDIVITGQDEKDSSSKRIARTISTDAEREGITFKVFLEYVREIVIEEKGLDEGEEMMLFITFLMIKDKNISFAVYLDGWTG